MKKLNVQYITKHEYNQFKQSLVDELKVHGFKAKGVLNKQDFCKLLTILKNKGFEEVTNVFEDDTIKEIYYGRLFQSHKERVNYEFSVRVRKFYHCGDDYHYAIYTDCFYPKNKCQKMPKKSTCTNMFIYKRR